MNITRLSLALLLSLAASTGCNRTSTESSATPAAPAAPTTATTATPTAAAPVAPAAAPAAPAAPAGAPTCQAVVDKLIALGGGQNPMFSPARRDSMIAGCTRANNLPQHTAEANCILAAANIDGLDRCGHAMDLIGPW